MKKALIVTGFLTCILVANNASAEYDTVPANSITIGKFTLPDFGGGSSGCTNIQFDSAYSGDVVTITPMCYDDPSNPTQLGDSFTVSNGSAGSSGCWSTSWGAYVAPSECTGRNQDLCKTKGHKDLIIAPTGETGCNYGSGTPTTTTIPFEDKCVLSTFGIAGSGKKGDIYDCTRQDDDSAYQWYSQHAIMTITKTYYETKNGKPGYIENKSGDVVLPPTIDKCDPVVFALEDKTANSVTKKVVHATQTCYVGDIAGADNGTGNSKTWQTGESYTLSGGDLPDDVLSYNYYASADGMPGYLVTTKNGVAGPNVYDSICEYEVLARGTQNASTNTTYKAGALKKRCQVQPLPTGTTKHDTNLNEGNWYDVADATPQPLPDDPQICDLAETGQTKKVTRTYVAHTTTKRGYYQTSTTKCGSDEADDSYEYDRCSPATDANGTCTGNNQAYMDCTQGNTSTHYQICESLGSDITPLSKHVDDVKVTAENAASLAQTAKDTADTALQDSDLTESTLLTKLGTSVVKTADFTSKITTEMNSGVLQTVTEKANAALPADQLAAKLQAEMTNNNGVLKTVTEKANAALPASDLTEAAILNKLQINDSSSTLGAKLNTMETNITSKADSSALSGYVAKEGNDANSFATMFGNQLNTAMNSTADGSLGKKLTDATTAANNAVSAVANKVDKSTLDDYVAKDGSDPNSFATVFGNQLNTAMNSTADGSLGKKLSDKLSASDLSSALVDGTATSGTLGAILRSKIDTAVEAMLNDTNSRLSQTIQAAADSRQ